MDEDNGGWITSFSLHAIEAVMARAEEYSSLQQFLEFVLEHPYLNVYYTTVEQEVEVSRLAPSVRLDMDDALQYFVAKREDLTLVTLDRDFRKVKGISLRSPG
jgi:predicted nucleic acid-binding protein